MSGEAEELKRKLEAMLTSSDTEWVNSITVTLKVMYRQFELERQRKKDDRPSYGLVPGGGQLPN